MCAAAAVLAAAEFRTSPQASVMVIGGATMSGEHFLPEVLAPLRAHFAGCKRLALVLHASHPTERDAMEARLQKAFAEVGPITAMSLHRLDAASARDLLQQADGIVVGGGETFVLLGELYRTGQLELIRERVLAGVPYMGSSAGANVAGLLIGTTNDFPTAEIPSRDALGVFPAVINPHHPLPAAKADYDSRVGKLKAYLRFNPGETVLALANASSARLHEGRVTIVGGTAWLYRAGAVQPLPVGQVVPELVR
ncbi:MAG: Type 1 glutamine amidotransferase-like domain-containing protein [Verrucomicrobia bacterium]|nr:Type 1 glutamine amidotransferase-like domain-containing protein [Verrucomicrobiota bacterium]